MRVATRQFSEYRDIHAGQSIIVCGCGVSLNTLPLPPNCITIGVNDVGRLFTPDYLVVLNARYQFKGDRFKYVENSRAQGIFTHLGLSLKHPNVIRFRLGQRGGIKWDAGSLPYTQNSPYVGLCLAAYMGATRIGLIGVDFNEHHFFAKTGKHALSGNLDKTNQEYQRLYRDLMRKGVEVVNLSASSMLNTIPKSDMATFMDKSTSFFDGDTYSKTLRVASYSMTPVAGVPSILADCITEKTPHRAVCVWARNNYSNGVQYWGGVQWKVTPGEAKRHLEDADLVIIHNGKVAPEHKSIVDDKPVITMAHNYMWNVDQAYVKRGFPGVVVGQYQATLPEFRYWHIVPNPVPLWQPEYQSRQKNAEITVCYTPSGKHESYPSGHKLYWHAKGYKTTMAILTRLAVRYPIKLEVIRDRQLPHATVLAMKSSSHIVIDECVTGSYHRNSLEGLAMGCVVINGMGLLNGVEEVFHECSLTEGRIPFVRADLENLEPTLTMLIEAGRDKLVELGNENRLWMERHWGFEAQWRNIWQPVVQEALNAQHPKTRVQRVVTVERVNTGEDGSVMKPRSNKKPFRSKVKIQAAGERMLSRPSESSIAVYGSCRSNRGNFGDLLSPLLVEALSGRKACFQAMAPRLFAVGSLLKFARSGDEVWGAGFISQRDSCEHKLRVHAVRGPETRRKLLRLGVDCPEIYGDPALLMPMLYSLPSVHREGIGVIPHYADYAYVKHSLDERGVRIIDIRSGVKNVLSDLGCCELVLSSSLHGCIIAEAYGIPAAWVIISDKVVGHGFKFRDYYAATDREAICVDWRHGIGLAKAEKVALESPPLKFDVQPLLKAFPYIKNTMLKPEPLSGKDAGSTKVESQSVSYESRPYKKIRRRVADRVNKPAYTPRTSSNLVVDDGESELSAARLAVFCVGTENYVPCMVTTLRSFSEKNESQSFDNYIIGKSFSRKTTALIEYYGIRYLNLDLNEAFKQRAGDLYPSECFWIFKGPELFHKLGYEYSLAVDGDIWCNQHINIAWLSEVKHIAGIDRGCNVGEFLSNIGQYYSCKTRLRVSLAGMQRRATNTGVLFFNNKNLSDLNFFEIIVDVYNRSESMGIRRRGDDSTFALALAMHAELEFTIIDRGWNYYFGLNAKSLHSREYSKNSSEVTSTDIKIFHHLKVKPWASTRRDISLLLSNFIEKWRNLWQNTLATSVQLEEQLKNRVDGKGLVGRRLRVINKEAIFNVACYHYRGKSPNCGDEIAPYLIRKVAGLSDNVRLKQSPCEPGMANEPVLLSVGSVLRLCTSNTVVWGSGIRNIDQEVRNAYRFCAVRGPLTRMRLLQMGYMCPAIYGDPALLLPRYFNPVVDKTYELGILPHLQDFAALKKLYGNQRDVLVLDLSTEDVEAVITSILSCKNTLSSTLHGIIVSVAYGIPTRWLRFSDKVFGDDTKFYDFFSTVEPEIVRVLDKKRVAIPESELSLERYRPISMDNGAPPVIELIPQTYQYQCNININELLEACPIDSGGWKREILQSDSHATWDLGETKAARVSKSTGRALAPS